MKWSISLPPKVTEVLKKHRLWVLLLLVGMMLVLLPDKKKESAVAEPVTAVQESELTTEQRLEELLGQIDGAGKVRVMLTVAEGEEIRYQTDTARRSGGVEEQETSVTVETVLSDTGNASAPIPVQTTAPVYRGAVIVAEGADRAAVRLNLTEAVMSLTGLGADKITVIKMKTN